MKTPKKLFTVMTLMLFLILSASSSLYAAAGGPTAPWYTDGACFPGGTYGGTLYIIFDDTGKKKVSGKIGNEAGESYREFVVEMKFILEVETSSGPLYFSGIGKTCEDSYTSTSDLPICSAGEEGYYDQFYLPGDYATRVGAAFHTFLQETVYPVLSSTPADCFLCDDTDFSAGVGNAEDVVNLSLDLPPSPPWYWAQPVSIVVPSTIVSPPN